MLRVRSPQVAGDAGDRSFPPSLPPSSAHCQWAPPLVNAVACLIAASQVHPAPRNCTSAPSVYTAHAQISWYHHRHVVIHPPHIHKVKYARRAGSSRAYSTLFHLNSPLRTRPPFYNSKRNNTQHGFNPLVHVHRNDSRNHQLFPI